MSLGTLMFIIYVKIIIFKILLPENCSVSNVKFFKVTDGNKILVEGIQPIVMKVNNRFKIELQIMNFDKNDKYTVTWTLN